MKCKCTPDWNSRYVSSLFCWTPDMLHAYRDVTRRKAFKLGRCLLQIIWRPSPLQGLWVWLSKTRVFIEAVNLGTMFFSFWFLVEPILFGTWTQSCWRNDRMPLDGQRTSTHLDHTAAVHCQCWRREEGGWQWTWCVDGVEWTCWCRYNQTSWSWSRWGLKPQFRNIPECRAGSAFTFSSSGDSVAQLATLTTAVCAAAVWPAETNIKTLRLLYRAETHQLPSKTLPVSLFLNVTHHSYSVFIFTCSSVVSEVILHFFILRYCVIVPLAVEHVLALNQGSWKIYSLLLESFICTTLCRNSTVQFSSVPTCVGSLCRL